MKRVRGSVFVVSFLLSILASWEVAADHIQTVVRFQRWVGLYLVMASVGLRFSLPLVPSRPKLIFEIISIVLLTRLLARLILLLVNSNLIVLFRATNVTASLAWSLTSLTPLFLFALIPILRNVSWYYLVAYFAICGGSVVASFFAVSVGLGLAWKHTVTNPWTDSDFFFLSR